MTAKDRVIVEILSRSNKKELASLNQLLGKYCPYLPLLQEGFVFPDFRKGIKDDYKKILTIGRKYYGDKLELVWRDLTEERWKRDRYHHKNMPKVSKQDNKKTYIGNGGDNRNRIRYPSLKRSKATWRRFYALFPNAEKRKEV